MNDQLYFGCALTAVSAASGLSIELCAATASALLGGVAGPHAGITDTAGAVVTPATNLIISGTSPRFTRGLDLLLSPIEENQLILRELSASLHRTRAEALENSHTCVGATNGIVNGDPRDDFTATNATYHRRFQTLRQPAVMLRNPDPAHFATSCEDILDGCALVVEDRLFSGTSKSRQQYVTALTDAVAGVDRLRPRHQGYGTTQTFRANVVALCSNEELNTALADLGLLPRCLVLDIPKQHTLPVTTLKATRDGYYFYRETVRELFIFRRSGTGVQYDAEHWAPQMQDYINSMQAWLDKLPAELMPYFTTALSLPFKTSGPCGHWWPVENQRTGAWPPPRTPQTGYWSASETCCRIS